MSTAIESVSDAELLGAEITELCSYIYAAESRLLTLIREFDETEYWAQQGLCSCAHWLNFKCGIEVPHREAPAGCRVRQRAIQQPGSDALLRSRRLPRHQSALAG